MGRVIDAIEELEILDDTLIYYIIGDNGASAEGTINGAFNEMANFNGMAALETPEFMLSKLLRARYADLVQPLRRAAGPGPWTPPTSGPSRSPRTGVAPVTAPSSTGPGRHRRAGRHPIAVLSRHRRGPDHPRSGWHPEPLSVERRAAVPHRGDQHALQP